MSRAQITNSTLHVIARSPFELHYEGPATIVSALNKVGKFDLLPGHADFFSVLRPGDVLIYAENQSEPLTIPAANGIITVRDDQVMVFLNM